MMSRVASCASRVPPPAQTEKQRIIWAYKILFLDVLFPLGLRKVIFMDSDQIIRTDVSELWHMDLRVRIIVPLLQRLRGQQAARPPIVCTAVRGRCPQHVMPPRQQGYPCHGSLRCMCKVGCQPAL